jgi:hypothetical protein
METKNARGNPPRQSASNESKVVKGGNSSITMFFKKGNDKQEESKSKPLCVE